MKIYFAGKMPALHNLQPTVGRTHSLIELLLKKFA